MTTLYLPRLFRFSDLQNLVLLCINVHVRYSCRGARFQSVCMRGTVGGAAEERKGLFFLNTPSLDLRAYEKLKFGLNSVGIKRVCEYIAFHCSTCELS